LSSTSEARISAESAPHSEHDAARTRADDGGGVVPHLPASRGAGMLEAAQLASERLSRALEAENFAGWDPYDALSSPIIRRLAATRLLRGAAIQALKRSPVNVRRFVGVPKRQHAKALAVLVSAYVLMAQTESSRHDRTLAARLAGALAGRAIRTPEGVGWGYDFDVQTRWGYYRAGHPNAVVTAFTANAMLDASSFLEPDGPAEGESAFEELVDEALTYVSSALVADANGERYFTYFAGSTTAIHNASLLLVGVCARSAPPGSPLWRLAEDALSYSVARQRPDGSWPYGEERGLGWVDGYHTLYVLESLAKWHERTGDPAVHDVLVRGLRFYLDRLVDPDGAPRAIVTSRYPIDIHAAATGIAGLCRLRRYDERAFPTATSMLGWTLRAMQRRDGRFAFQRHRLFRNATPYVRWNDAHMLLALASYAAAEAPGAEL
jgi:hypothetical protein